MVPLKGPDETLDILLAHYRCYQFSHKWCLFGNDEQIQNDAVIELICELYVCCNITF